MQKGKGKRKAEMSPAVAAVYSQAEYNKEKITYMIISTDAERAFQMQKRPRSNKFSKALRNKINT